MRHDSLKIGGALYVVAVFQFFIFELVAETLYPGYSVAKNYISDLGATCVNPPSTASCVVLQPTATIFNTSLMLLGLLLLVGTFLVYHGTRKKPYFIVTIVADIAIFLAGVFPENTGWIHADVSVILFPLTGISLILAWTLVKGSIFRYLVVAFGVLTLYFNSFGVSEVGVGGSERLLVLSILSGMMALGGYLTGRDSPPVQVANQNTIPLRKVIARRKLFLIGIVLMAIGLGLLLIIPSIHGTSGSLSPGCSKQSNGQVTCSNTTGNSNVAPLVSNGGELNSLVNIQRIVSVLLIGMGLILVVRGVFSKGTIAHQTKTVN